MGVDEGGLQVINKVEKVIILPYSTYSPVALIPERRPQSFRHQRRPVDDTVAHKRLRGCHPIIITEWRKTAEPGAERFTAKWVAAEKARNVRIFFKHGLMRKKAACQKQARLILVPNGAFPKMEILS